MELKYHKLLLNDVYAQAVNSAVIPTSLLKGSGFAAQLIVANNAPSAKAFGSGAYEVNTVTFPDYATFVENDYLISTAVDGLSYAISGVKLGGAVEPTGALWVAIPGARKALVDLTGLVTAAQVAAAFEVAFDALTGYTAKITTDDSAANGTMTFTQVIPGVVVNMVPKNADDSGAGTISIAETTPGTATDVNITSNAITETAHGYKNGLKVALSTAGVLPTGLSATDYYLIYVDANTYKFATSQANALAGTAVDITDYGTGTHTVTPNVTLAATITLKQSLDGTNFDQIDSLTEAISAVGNFILQKDVIHAPYVRVDMAVTSGQLELDLWVSSRGD